MEKSDQPDRQSVNALELGRWLDLMDRYGSDASQLFCGDGSHEGCRYMPCTGHALLRRSAEVFPPPFGGQHDGLHLHGMGKDKIVAVNGFVREFGDQGDAWRLV